MSPLSELDEVIASLSRGEVVVIPTDTVYGLAADPTSEEAMRRLFEVKRRPAGVPVAVLIADRRQADGLVEPGEHFDRLARQHWPGALTLVAYQREPGRLHIGDDETIGVRQPADDFVRSVAADFGPIAASSANRHGELVVVDGEQAKTLFAGEIEVIVDGGRRDVVASTVVDVTGTAPRILRQGVVSIEPDTN